MNHSPVQGLRIAVTRPDDGADELADRLGHVGAIVIRVPLVRVSGAHDPASLQQALTRLDEYDWIVFTSANAARFTARMLALTDAPARPRGRVVAIGPATRDAVVAALGWRVDLSPGEHVGDVIVQTMASVEELRGRRVLWPRARAAGDAVRRHLAAAGALLDDPEAYGTDAVPEAAAELAAMLARGELAALTLTSPSAVAALAAAQPRLGSCIVAVIGPTTRAAAEAAGLTVHVEPAEHTIPALVDELVRFFARARE